jgi:hypothetical protein
VLRGASLAQSGAVHVAQLLWSLAHSASNPLLHGTPKGKEVTIQKKQPESDRKTAVVGQECAAAPCLHTALGDPSSGTSPWQDHSFDGNNKSGR